MSDRTVKVTRRRLLGGLATVGGAGLATGAGTMAAFSDIETSSSNVIQAGTLELTVDGESQSVTLFEDATEIAPGDEGEDTVTLGNDGSIDGDVELSLDEVRNSENSHLQSEQDQGDDSPNEGELQDFLEVRAEIAGTELVDWTDLADLPTPETYSPGVTLSQGETTDFLVEWRFPKPSSNNPELNVAQSDSVELDISFTLVQSGSG